MSDPDVSVTPQAPPDRGAVIGAGGAWLAKWSLTIVAIAAGAVVLGWIAAKLWVIVLPVLLAVVLCTVMWPPRAERRRDPSSASPAATSPCTARPRAAPAARSPAVWRRSSRPPRRPRR